MKTPLQIELKKISPSIALSTTWEHDDTPDTYIFRDGNALDGENPEDWQQWQSTVSATAVVCGELFVGNAYMGSTWEKYGNKPWEVNPEISGYERQMTIEAVTELLTLIKDSVGTQPLPDGIRKDGVTALEFLKSHM